MPKIAHHERPVVRRVLTYLADKGPAGVNQISRGTKSSAPAVCQALEWLMSVDAGKGPVVLRNRAGKYYVNPAYGNPHLHVLYVAAYCALLITGTIFVISGVLPVGAWLLLACGILGFPGVVKSLVFKMQKKALLLLDAISPEE